MPPALTRFKTRVTQLRLSRSRLFTRYPFAFVVTFVAFAVATILAHYKYTFWPGQDDNYDDFCSMVVARYGRDPYITRLFLPLKLWHSQTFLYFTAGTLGKIVDPTVAVRIVFVTLYFLGVPAVTAWILTDEKRSPWGAILSFPVIYSRTWSFGFLKYAMSAPFFLLTIFSFVRLFRNEKITWKTVALYFVSVWILYMSHTQAYAFAGVLLFIIWLGFLADRLSRAASMPPPHLSFPEFLKRSTFGLAASLPSLYAWTAWFKETNGQLGTFADTTSWSDLLLEATDEKFRVTNLLLAITKAPDEMEQVVFLFCIVVFVGAVRRFGANDRSPIPEVLFGVTFVSQFILPGTIHGQMIGQRHMDMALWLLPLCITPALWKRNRIASIATCFAIVYYARARLTSLWEYLALLNNQDMAGPRCDRQYGARRPLSDHASNLWRAGHTALAGVYDRPEFCVHRRAEGLRRPDLRHARARCGNPLSARAAVAAHPHFERLQLVAKTLSVEGLRPRPYL